MKEKDVLLKFLQSDTPASWILQRETGWSQNSTENVCTWDGITCGSSNKIYAIDLKASNYVGTIPDEIGSLNHLSYLYLSGNEIHGTIPDSIALHNRLVHFDVSENQLRGNIPIFRSPRIQVLNFSRNRLTGNIPDDIASTGGAVEDSSSLLIFDMKYNFIDGTIPASFGYISANLMDLDLSNNRLLGTIPMSLGNLDQLKGLFLSNNKLHGSIPPQLLQNKKNLEQLFVHGNLLSGTVPIGLADLPSIKNLFIDDNKFTGTIPHDLCELNLNEEFFQSDPLSVRGGDTDYDDMYNDNDNGGYELDGSIYQTTVYKKGKKDKGGSKGIRPQNSYQMEKSLPSENDYDDLEMQIKELQEEIERLKEAGGDELNGRYLSENYRSFEINHQTTRTGCNSIACPAGYRSTDEGKEGVFPCVKCEVPFVNPYLGSTECHEVNQRLILSHFYFATHGKEWVGNYDNWDRQGVPVCTWEGVECNAQDDIVKIELPDSNLFGTISEDLGYLRHLVVLDLSGNQLFGNIPSELHYPPLEVLDLSKNSFTGFVPPALCNKDGINGNGEDGNFLCANIVCPSGMYSSTGRMSADEACTECSFEGNVFLGATTCEDMGVSSSFLSVESVDTMFSADEPGAVLLGLVGIAGLCGIIFIAINSKWKRKSNWEEKYGENYGLKKKGPVVTAGKPLTFDQLNSGTFAMSAVEVKAQDHWNTSKDTTKEVWLDVPKIH